MCLTIVFGFLLTFGATLHVALGGCSGGVSRCNWTPWKSWSECSSTCGGGRRYRYRPYCCNIDLVDRIEDCMSDCGRDMTYYDDNRSQREDCNNWCYHGGIFDNMCKCTDEYYGSCCGEKCPSIRNCKRVRCTSYYNNICKECDDDNVFFKRTNYDRSCERLCAWNGHYCWPGRCADDLTKGCQCPADFSKTSTNTETSCQPSKLPSILTCDTTVSIGTNGKKKQALSSGISTACKDLEDMWGNLQPTALDFKFLAEFTVNYSSFSKPNFIVESNFGVTDSTLYLLHVPVSGSAITKTSHRLLQDTSSSVNASPQWKRSGNFNIDPYMLQNGESLCFKYESKGGGFLRSKSMVTHITNSPVPYDKVTASEQICYHFDNEPPIHCMADKTCPIEPIQIPGRVTRSTNTTVIFSGWEDPSPTGGSNRQASSIESYTVTVNEVLPSKGTLQVDHHNVFTQLVNTSYNRLDVYLPSNKPRLYSITLEVKDVADNVRKTRRFMLYDNTSYIETHTAYPYRVTSASVNTNYKWQTHHHNISLSWVNRFINRFYFENSLLNDIAPDHFGMISGVYEQTTGILPVSGTPNVHGIVEFTMAWSLNGGIFTKEMAVPDFLNQTFSKDLNVQDGQKYAFLIKAIDIVGNTITDNVSVSIDRSPPHINNMWLVKDGHKTLFVHHNTDLSKMQMYFEALDPHSGLRNIEWRLGLTDAGLELSTGHMSVGSTENTSCPIGSLQCYCPDIGLCEFFNYTVPLNKLVEANKHIGNHNRNYYFTVKVTNNAMLTNIEHVDILVDDSPPETGVIYEGPLDSNDIDYTSEDIFTVHWHGFIDHESGIKEYRIGVSHRCLSQTELYNTSVVPDVEYYVSVPFTETSATIPAHFIGKRVVSIIALNNAMDPSSSVCSDGITRDISPPGLRNITFDHASWSDSIGCHQGDAWLFHSSLQRVQLANHTVCKDLCSDHIEYNPLIAALPLRVEESGDADVAEFLCLTLPTYNNETIIYLPNNHINIKWDVQETGSQINDFRVALGAHPSEVETPSIASYVSLARRRHFSRRHTGVGSNELFYIFVKTVNKANKESVTTLGPVLIDETPPLYRKLPTVNVSDSSITVQWENDTFYDMEQQEQINSIFWQVGHGTEFLTPLYQWSLYSSQKCQGTANCFKYPLHKLQLQDTDLGLDFYFSLHVYNNAGHSLQIRSDTFRLPSKYPPGHGVVLDIDPANPESHRDTNLHFSPNTLCVEWFGFRHHQDVHLELGIGRSNFTDDVISFMYLNESNTSNSHCISSPLLTFGVRYFSIIRATCSGGITVSSSDGTTIMNETDVLESLKIQPGEQCSSKSSIATRILGVGDHELNVSFNAIEGQFYRIMMNKAHNITSEDGILYEKDGILNFVAFTSTPLLNHVLAEENLTLSDESFLNIVHCPAPKYYATQNRVGAFWHSELNIPNGGSFEIATARAKTDLKSEVEYVTLFENYGRTNTHVFNSVGLVEGDMYMVAVKLCSNSHCIGPVFSESFSANPIPPTGTITTSTLVDEADCSRAHVVWDRFTSEDTVLFYQWTIAKDTSVHQVLTDWKTEIATTERSYKISQCVSLPLHYHAAMYSCVRAFTDGGLQGQTCIKLQYQTYGQYKSEAVYDFDGNSEAWSIVKTVHSSSNIGDAYELLHDNEMNVATSDDDILGVMLYGTERNITWYLMTKTSVPSDCRLDINCVSSTVTQDGFVRFDPKYISTDTLYYICAHSDSQHIVRETHTEIQHEINSCSNGFIIDNTPPVAGHISVSNTSGYINSLHGIHVAWEDFQDNINASLVGYPNNIQNYRVAIGHQPSLDDVVPFTNVGDTRGYFFNNINVSDGSVLFVSVEGSDYADLTTVSSSSELLVDTSPPHRGKITFDRQHFSKSHVPYITSEKLTVHLTGFHDEHSGIELIQVGVGTQPALDDIIQMTDYHDNHVEITLSSAFQVDGYGYYVIAVAMNRAGLKSQYVSSFIQVDRSGPTGGHVFDGHSMGMSDVDYHITMTEIKASWNGFDDIHSGIAYYRAGLGTRPYTDDIEPLTNVGLDQDISWKGKFQSGQRYYVLIEAYNGAGLITKRSSDGIVLDNSPPTKGVVWVGSYDNHQKYIPYRSSLPVRWIGFDDAQSGIEHYEVCVGSRPYNCDIQPLKSSLLSSHIILTGLHLPIQTDLYVTVIAINHVGLNVSQTSDSFRVDDSAPFVIRKPGFDLGCTSINDENGQWDMSLLRLYWKFGDDESPITTHEISIITHHEGHTPIEHLKLHNQNEITISLEADNLLHNGDRYTAVVTSCNQAGLCATEESNELLIDSTPPHVGGFKPPLTWNNYLADSEVKTNISLTWYGFLDQESGVRKYYISASRSYSEDELLSNALVETNSDDTSADFSQMFTLSEVLNPDDDVVLSIWAENEVGLNSTVARLTVNAIGTTSTYNVSELQGLLELEKHSCDIHYCNKDCTCAVFGKPCVDVQTNLTCISLDSTSTKFDKPVLEVRTGTRGQSVNITASSACLAAHWDVRDINTSTSGIQRFEWSVGLHDQPVGDGVFDLKSENPWTDVGLRTEAIHCLPTNRSLLHGNDYIFYVRAWYDMETYATFTSEIIKIDQTPPSVRRGKTVIDSDRTCRGDVDVIDWMDTISACWTDVFSEQQGSILYYTVSLGTAFHADDVIQDTNMGLNTTVTLTDLSLDHGTRYFFTVTAYNNVGLQKSTTSDGFIIDMDIPTAGVVYNTGRMKNTKFQSDRSSLSFSWHGFQDLHSGIQAYKLGVTTNPQNLDDLFINLTDIQLNTKWTFHGLDLDHGMTYYGLVQAIDYSCHQSDIVTSDGVTMDTTPPRGYACQHFTNIYNVSNQTYVGETLLVTSHVNLAVNKLYRVHGHMNTLDETPEIIMSFAKSRNIVPVFFSHNETVLYENDFTVQENNGYNITLESTASSSGYIDVLIDECDTVVEDSQHAVQVKQVEKDTVAVSIFILDVESSLRKVLGAGSTETGLQIQPLSHIYHSNNHVIIHTDGVSHGTPMYVTVIAENHAGLKTTVRTKPINIDHTSPYIGDVIGELEYSEVNVSGRIEYKTTVNVSWSAVDEESGIQYCTCSLGSSPGLANIQPYWQSNTASSFYSDGHVLPHGTIVYANVKCVNNIEMSTDISSSGLIVSTERPVTDLARVSFVPINEGSSLYTSASGSSIPVQSNRSSLHLSWDRFEDLSGVSRVEYQILYGDHAAVGWTSISRRHDNVIYGLHLMDGCYLAEVRAVNVGGHVSDSVYASVIIAGSEPRLTGRPIKMHIEDDVLQLDWSGVFHTDSNVSASYSLYIGTRYGIADVVDVSYTSDTSYEVTIPLYTLITPNPTELFIKLQCLYATGLSSAVETTYKLNK